MEGNRFLANAGAGVFLDGASATLSGNVYEGSGLDLVRQRCSLAESPETTGDGHSTTDICPTYDYLTRDFSLGLYVEEEAFVGGLSDPPGAE